MFKISIKTESHENNICNLSLDIEMNGLTCCKENTIPNVIYCSCGNV